MTLSSNTIDMLLGAFFLDERAAEGYKAQLKAAIESNYTREQLKEIRAELVSNTAPLFSRQIAPGQSQIGFFSTQSGEPVQPGSIALIRVQGFISEHGDWCMKGLVDYERELNAAGENENIKGVILQVDSNGGSVYGVERFSGIVSGFQRKYSKPLAALAKNKALSAGYFIIAGAPKIFVSGNMSEVGSIGTMVTIYDDKKGLEKYGLTQHIINASQSTNKNKSYMDALKGDYTLMREWLDDFNKVFLDTVESGRGSKINRAEMLDIEMADGTTKATPEPLTGKVYMGRKAIQAGLADEIGDLEAVMAYIDNAAARMGYEPGSGTVAEPIETDENEEDGDDFFFSQILQLKQNSEGMNFKNIADDVLASQMKQAVEKVNAVLTEKGADSPEYAKQAAILSAFQQETEMRNSRKEIAELKQRLADAHAAQKQDEGSKQQELQAQIEALQNEKTEQQAAVLEFERKNTEQAEQLQKIAAELNELREQIKLSGEEKAALQQKNTELQSNIDALQKAYADDDAPGGKLPAPKTDGKQPTVDTPPPAPLTFEQQVRQINRAIFNNNPKTN